MPRPSDSEILELLNELDRVPAGELESDWLDFKPWKNAREDLKVAIEYAVCFANGKGGAVVFGVEDKMMGRSKAIHGIGNCDLDVWCRGISDATRPNLSAEVSELAVPEGTGKILVVRVAKSETGVLYGTAGGVFKQRVGKNCMPIDPQAFMRQSVLTAAERELVLAARAGSCDDGATEENHDEPGTASTTRSAPESVAGKPRGRAKPEGGVSPAGTEFHPEFDGAGKRAGQLGSAGEASGSTRPLEATRELATSAGLLAYSEVAERLAVNIAHCLEALLESSPQDIRITPEWICEIHRLIAGDLFPEWAGRFRATDVQVGTHLPPPVHEVAIHIKNFCLDMEERLRHLQGAEPIAELLAWADWRFQWIHPFKDFNGRVGRILLIALAYKLVLPPIDPASGESGKADYFSALRAADTGDFAELNDLWLNRLLQDSAAQST
ncbi:MAG: Fic family protein [Burkholderiales bacterium]|nr:Fic family protein [Burkholderiales bacterium]